MLSFREESWATYAPDAHPLWSAHWHEIHDGRSTSPDAAHARMRINENWYIAAEAAHALSIVTARAAGQLVGWVICSFGPNSHYADVVSATEDTYWLAPEHRSGLTGAKMIRFAEQALRARGVRLVHFMSHENKPLDRLFRFLRYRKTHSVYSRWIGE